MSNAATAPKMSSEGTGCTAVRLLGFFFPGDGREILIAMLRSVSPLIAAPNIAVVKLLSPAIVLVSSDLFFGAKILTVTVTYREIVQEA